MPRSGWSNSVRDCTIRKKLSARIGDEAVRHGAGDNEVIAGLERQRAEVGFERARAAVDEHQLVAIGIAVVERHGRGAARDVQGYVVVAQEGDREARGVVQVVRLKAVQVEAVRPQRAFEADPAGGRVRMVEMRALAVKAFAPVLFLVSALGQPDVRLPGKLAFLERVHAALLLPA